MALVQVNATVGTSAAFLHKIPSGLPYTVVTINNGGANTIYIGNSASVATSGANTGMNLATNTSATLCLNSGDSIFAIAGTANATGTCQILYSGI